MRGTHASPTALHQGQPGWPVSLPERRLSRDGPPHSPCPGLTQLTAPCSMSAPNLHSRLFLRKIILSQTKLLIPN